jgi:NAD(P)-dependent dehydrogenase (short-subunit alcohol dehydrogenase family)
MKVNLDGVINGIVTFVDDIRTHGEGGHFVNTASIAGHYGMPRLGIYCASKFAVVGISETLRADLAPDNIGVSVLCPGIVATGIGESERNRPDEFGGSRKPAMTRPEGEPPRQNNGQPMEVLEPSAIGDMVLHAMMNDHFYILSHDEFRPALERRADEIAGSFTNWRAWRDEHGV